MKINVGSQGGDHMLGIDNLDCGISDDVLGKHSTLLRSLNSNNLRLVRSVTNNKTLDVQDDVHHIFNNTRNASDLMGYATNLHLGDSTTLEA